MGRKRKPTYARLDPFTRGMIWGMHCAGASREDIYKQVTKADKTPVSPTAVSEVISHMQQDPGWRGADTDSGDRGRPSQLTDKDKKEIQDVVFDFKAKACVTTRFIQKKIPRLRGVSRWCLSRALHQAGLAWLQRRTKRAVPTKYKKPRLDYCQWIKHQRQELLNRFAYTDGTTIYLARTEEEHQDKQRAALGKYCWRMA